MALRDDRLRGFTSVRVLFAQVAPVLAQSDERENVRVPITREFLEHDKLHPFVAGVSG